MRSIKTFGRVLNYMHYLLIAISAILDVFPLLAFLVGIPIGNTNSAIGFKICAITVGIKKYKLIVKKKKKKHEKIGLLAKSKWNSVEVLISKILIDPNIIHNEFVLINNVLKGFYDMKEEIKNSNDK